MCRQALPLVLLLSISSTAGAATQLQKVISDLLGTTSGDTSNTRCESLEGQQRTCKVPAGYRAEFVRQLSRTDCVQGKTLFISASEVVVARGCRAEFRLVETAANGNLPGASGNLETVLAAGLREKLVKPQNEYGSLYDVRILTNKLVSSAGSSEPVYEGTANSSWGGRTYPLEYSARIDARTGRLMNLDYRYRNPNAEGSTSASSQWLAGTALDAEARTALAMAIRADYQKRNGGRHVQVVTNSAYKEQAVTRSDYRFTGHYGVSIDDGNWQTFRYSARIFLPRNAVSELETNAQNP
jgi:hypothetical protein